MSGLLQEGLAYAGRGGPLAVNPDRHGHGVYVPDNPALREVLADGAGRGFRPDHARLLLHFIAVKRWMGDVDNRGFARLSAGILRTWIQPRAFAALKTYLLETGILIMDSYSVGRRATGFKIAPGFDGPPRREIIECGRLAEKVSAWRASCKTAGDDSDLAAILARRKTLLDHQRDSLARLSLPMSPAALAESLRGQANEGHVAYVTECIQNGDDDGLVVDAFGRRIHSLITRTSSALRPLLLLDGAAVAEVDVANSQPTVLAGLFLHAQHMEANAQHIKGMHNIVEGPGDGVSLLFSSLPVREVRGFVDACESGSLYELLSEGSGLSREQAKRQMFRDVLFGRPRVSGPLTRAFDERWPSLLAAIRAAKLRHGYKVLAQALQRQESVIMLDSIGPRMLRELPGVAWLTIHDSALLASTAVDQVCDIMLDEFGKWGIKPTIRVKRGVRRGQAGEAEVLTNE